jgi:hypothetical protein
MNHVTGRQKLLKKEEIESKLKEKDKEGIRGKAEILQKESEGKLYKHNRRMWIKECGIWGKSVKIVEIKMV